MSHNPYEIEGRGRLQTVDVEVMKIRTWMAMDQMGTDTSLTV